MQSLSYKKDKKALTFEVEGNHYTIGSKLFPLSKKKNIGIWNSANTQEVNPNAQLLHFLDMVSNHDFVAGKCYRNSEVVRVVGEKLGLNIKLYSGWIFFYDRMPLHHAWNVLDNRIVIDTSLTKMHINLQQRFIEHLVSHPHLTADEQRQHYIEMYETSMKHRQPISQELLYGKPVEGLTYIGTEDTYYDSMKSIQALLEEVNPHPAYPHKRNEQGESEMQELLKEKGLF